MNAFVYTQEKKFAFGTRTLQDLDFLGLDRANAGVEPPQVQAKIQNFNFKIWTFVFMVPRNSRSQIVKNNFFHQNFGRGNEILGQPDESYSGDLPYPML